MMSLSFQQIEAFIAQMSLDKKAKLFYQLAKDITPLLGVEKTTGVCGGSACIIRTRIPVWTLVSFKKLGIQDVSLLTAYPTLRQQDLNNAWAYNEANKQEIEFDIKKIITYKFKRLIFNDLSAFKLLKSLKINPLKSYKS
jgi:uncharacterized protein (DUF433 family)